MRATTVRRRLRPATVLAVLAVMALWSVVTGHGATTSDARSTAPQVGGIGVEPITATDADDLVASLTASAATDVPGATISISVVQLGSGRLAVSGGDRLFKSASTAKAWFAAAALAMQPIEQVEPFARDVFADSSDLAAGKLIDLAGGPDAINMFTRERVGMADTGLVSWHGERVERATNAPSRLGDSNYTTTPDMARFLQRLAAGELLDAPKTEALLRWMQLSPRDHGQNDFGGRLPDQLPPSVRRGVAHKAGWLLPEDGEQFWLLDFGIVRADQREPYAVVIAGVTDDAFAPLKQFVSRASCETYRTMAADPSWTCPAD